MAYDTAQHKVLLAIPELLEAILLQLDQKSLLVNAQRVCRQWRQCIAETPSIQQHLFFLPEPYSSIPEPASSSSSSSSRSNSSDVKADANALGPSPRPNPLLARHFPEWFEHATTWPADQRLPFVRATAPASARGLDSDRLFPVLPWVHRRLEAYTHPRASWRRMLLQQPARHGIGFVMTHAGRRVVPGGSLPIIDRPVTMPELLELTNMCVPIRPGWPPGPADGNQQQQQRQAVTRFRVMWGRLSPELSPSSSESAGSTDELYPTLQRAMDKYGIVVQHDSWPHQPADTDEFVRRLGVLYLDDPM